MVFHGLFAIFYDELSQWTGWRCKHQGKADIAPLYGDIANHVQLNQAFLQFRVLDGTQNFENGIGT